MAWNHHATLVGRAHFPSSRECDERHRNHAYAAIRAIASPTKPSGEPEIAGAAEALTGSTGGSVLARVMDDDDRDIKRKRALEIAEVAEYGGDLTGIVLVDAVQTHKRIEDQEARHVGRDSLAQSELIVGSVEAQRRRGNEMNRQPRELGPREDLQTITDAGRAAC